MFAGPNWLKSNKRDLHGEQEPEKIECSVCYKYPAKWDTKSGQASGNGAADLFENRPMSRRANT